MRRHALHVATVLLVLSAGLAAACGEVGLAYLLLLAPASYLILGAVRKLCFDLHFLLVAALSVFLWSAGLVALLDYLSASAGGCVVDVSEVESVPPRRRPGK